MLKILEEENTQDENFGDILKEHERNLSKGSIQKCRIVLIDDDYAKLAVDGEKIEGNLPLEEITDKEGNLLYKQGDDIEVYVNLSSGKRPAVSFKKAKRFIKMKEKIETFPDDYKDIVIEGKIVKQNKGGFILEDADEVEYFLPKYESALKDRDRNVIGQTHKALIINIDKEKNSITVSRKKFFAIDNKQKQELIAKIIEENGILDGVVKNIIDFGAFIEISDGNTSVEGLVHFSEISHNSNVDPNKHFKKGESVKVKAIGYNKEKDRLSLSIKALTPDPWISIQEELKVGYSIKVTVSTILPYGAFVTVSSGVEALLHISEISWSKTQKDINDCLKVGDEIVVEVIEIDVKNKKLRVSLKNLTTKPFINFIKNHKEGDVVKGKIVNIIDMGAFVNLGDVDGLLKNKDISWGKEKTAKEEFKVGDEVEVVITRIDKDRENISLSKRALVDSPYDIFAKQYSNDSIIEAEVTSIKDFGVFVSVDNIDVLIRNEDLTPLKKEDIKIGDKIESAIVHIDKKNEKVGASVKRLERVREIENLKAFSNTEKMTLGDRFKIK